MTTKIIETIKAIAVVDSINAWQDRHYVNLRGYDRGFHGDRTCKVYVRGERVVMERGKGVLSQGYRASLDAFEAACKAAAVVIDWR